MGDQAARAPLLAREGVQGEPPVEMATLAAAVLASSVRRGASICRRAPLSSAPGSANVFHLLESLRRISCAQRASYALGLVYEDCFGFIRWTSPTAQRLIVKSATRVLPDF